MAINRTSVEDARQAVRSGQALLVCAYEDEAKCRSIGLEGAISLGEFKARADSLPREQAVIFYCA
jgi:hypothetical protein